MTLLDERWLLPEGVDEILPPLAEHLESARRELLDLYASWGYRLVIPPLVEHLESLLTAAGSDLDRQTFKLTDPHSARLIGVRADMTPQVARIDARHMPRDVPARLCYLGTTLRAQAEGLGGSRAPLQVGAELYGHAGIESDVEVVSLMLATLERLAVREVHLDLGHVGVFRGLSAEAGLAPRAEEALLEAMQRKDGADVAAVLAGVGERAARERIAALIELNGGLDTLDAARERLSGAGAGAAVREAVEVLARLASLLDRTGWRAPVHVDLAELRGYRYHTGVVFAAFVPGQGQEIARGGRYDDIGEAFGAARPATGFSADLKTLVALSAARSGGETALLEAPWSTDAALLARVAALRASGERVVFALPGGGGRPGACRRRLEQRDGEWTVVDIDGENPRT
jgi:ATP phosphoribosyltransferase regulatory subunit